MRYTSSEDIIEAKLIEQGEFGFFIRNLIGMSIEKLSEFLNVPCNKIDNFEQGIVEGEDISYKYFTCLESEIEKKNINLVDLLNYE